MTFIGFYGAVCRMLWDVYGVVADDSDETQARTMYAAGTRNVRDVAYKLANTHGIQ